MAQFRYVYTSFWEDPDIVENFTPEDRLFFIYLLTNPHTTQIGIYKITKKLISFELGYSIESVNALIARFEEHHKVIKYNTQTRELAIKNWGKFNLNKGGKPVVDCIKKEFKAVEDKSLLAYIARNIKNPNMKLLFMQELSKYYSEISEEIVPESDDTLDDRSDDSSCGSSTIRGQKENKNKNKKENKNKNLDNYMPDSNEYRLASYLFKFIKRNNPRAKEPNLQKWSKQFSYIMKIDKRTVEEIKEVIKFCQNDSFWLKNILSPEKLRKQFDRLLLEMQEQKLKKVKHIENYSKKESTFNNFKQRNYSKEDWKNLEEKLLGYQP
mgnify:CR=1 FL=1